jgi:hypothetical protein
MTTGKAWTDREQFLACVAYLVILTYEQAGKTINKAAMRRATLPLLEGRSGGSYEMKLCNISAAMHADGRPWVQGYKPLGNGQRSLLEWIDRAAFALPNLLPIADDAVIQPAGLPMIAAALFDDEAAA